MALKLTFKSFQELDTPDLLINIWCYSGHIIEKNGYCYICGTYRKYCIEIVKRRWRNEWGFFNEVIRNIKNNNENFIDLSRYSSANRHKIIRDLTKIQQRRTEGFGFIY